MAELAAVREPEWLKERRGEAARRAAELDVPRFKGKAGWEFTDLGDFSLERWTPAPGDDGEYTGARLLEPPPGAVELVQVDKNDVDLGHEATVSKIGEEQLFYLMSRGLSEAEASAMIVSGFVEPITKELPLEYAVEMNRLIQLQMEGSVG